MSELKFSNGRSMPILGIGFWSVPGPSVDVIIDTAVGASYRHFDCAYLYHNEREVGDALKKAMLKYGLKREDIFVTSKLWCTMKRPENVEKAFKSTLADLQLDYLDLYLIHFPLTFPPTKEDMPLDASGETLQYERVPIADTWKAMEALVDAGLVKSIGVSNFNRAQLDELLDSPECRIKPVNLQIEMHANFPNVKLTEYAQSKGLAVTGYSPLGSPGFSADVHKHASLLDAGWVKEIAAKHKKTAAQVLLRYIVQRGCSVIPKSVTPSRIIENVKIFDFELSGDDMKALRTKGTQIRAVYAKSMLKHPDYPFGAEY